MGDLVPIFLSCSVVTWECLVKTVNKARNISGEHAKMAEKCNVFKSMDFYFFVIETP